MSGLFKAKDNWGVNSKKAILFKPLQSSVIQGETKKSKIKKNLTKVEKRKKKQKKAGINLKQENPSKLLGPLHKVKTSTSLGPVLKAKVLRDKLRENLKGGHFRFINEQLYTTDGFSAQKMFIENPEDFQAYHEGYRHQIEQWPVNPLNRIIKYVQKQPKQWVVADFGCGEARLSKSVPHKVYSIDLVALSDDVIACDMANTPLESNYIDLAVYCLSLMGTNIQDFMLEANRVLKIGATLYIAEIASRFDNVDLFVKKMKTWGFELSKKDLNNKLFYFFIFKKNRNVDKNGTEEFSLKPCLYKKR